MLDRIIALLLFVLLSPVLLILLIITACIFKCNPIFVQERTICGQSTFKFYKIRTMIKQAPNIPTDEFKNAKDFITPWGSILRNTSADELLNLLCIINGDMQFIGPRPIMLTEFGLIELRKNNGVHCKPGITGLAQINGRDLISLKRKVACERYYNRNKSITLRIYILIKTLILVINKKGIAH